MTGRRRATPSSFDGLKMRANGIVMAIENLILSLSKDEVFGTTTREARP
jgi:hypothetical protein